MFVFLQFPRSSPLIINYDVVKPLVKYVVLWVVAENLLRREVGIQRVSLTYEWCALFTRPGEPPSTPPVAPIPVPHPPRPWHPSPCPHPPRQWLPSPCPHPGLLYYTYQLVILVPGEKSLIMQNERHSLVALLFIFLTETQMMLIECSMLAVWERVKARKLEDSSITDKKSILYSTLNLMKL